MGDDTFCEQHLELKLRGTGRHQAGAAAQHAGIWQPSPENLNSRYRER